MYVIAKITFLLLPFSASSFTLIVIANSGQAATIILTFLCNEYSKRIWEMTGMFF